MPSTNTRSRRTRADVQDNSPRPLTRKQVQEMLRRGRSLDHADARGIDLSGLCFDGVTLRATKLADANLSRCTFKGSDLSGASLWRANLKDADFEGATLDEADLDCANIDGCSFKDARVRKTIFPAQRSSLPQVKNSVRTGCKVRLDAIPEH